MEFKYGFRISDPEDLFLLRRVEDLAFSVERKKISVTTDFLNPFQCKLALSAVHSFSGVEVDISGGYSEAERVVMRLFPDFRSERALEELAFFTVETPDSLTHRSVLGSFLGLGVERKKIGDLLLGEEFVGIIVKREIGSFLEFHLKKIGRSNVSLKPVSADVLRPPKPLFLEKTATVSSLRLDSLISGAFCLSRNEASQVIKAGKIHVDFRLEDRPAFSVDPPALLSLRGKGRVTFVEVSGTTRKDRLRVVFQYPK